MEYSPLISIGISATAKSGAQHAGRLRPRDELVGQRVEALELGVGQPPGLGRARERLLDADVAHAQLRVGPQQPREGLPRVLDLEGALGVVAEGPELRGDELAQQRLLVREVAVDGPHAHAGLAGDVVHLRLDAALGEHGSRRRDDPLAVAPGVGAQGLGGLGVGGRHRRDLGVKGT